ncbi:hypothetical protein ACJX0J_027110 [Zea mays]
MVALVIDIGHYLKHAPSLYYYLRVDTNLKVIPYIIFHNDIYGYLGNLYAMQGAIIETKFLPVLTISNILYPQVVLLFMIKNYKLNERINLLQNYKYERYQYQEIIYRYRYRYRYRYLYDYINAVREIPEMI